MSLTGGIRPRRTFTFFEHCADQRFDDPWRIVSQTCDRCGITYAAHFDHPQRCPAWEIDELHIQLNAEPRLLV